MTTHTLSLIGHFIFGVLLALGIIGAIYINNYCKEKHQNDFKLELIHAYEDYYDATDSLLIDYHVYLDMNVSSEESYITAKHKVDSLYNTQL